MTMSTNEMELKNNNQILLEKIKNLENMIKNLESVVTGLQKENQEIKTQAKQTEYTLKEHIRGMEDNIDMLCGTIQELKNKAKYSGC